MLTQAISVCMLGVIYYFLGDKRKVHVFFISAIFMVLILFSFIIPDKLLYGESEPFRHFTLSSGSHIIIMENGFSLWKILMDITILTFVTFSFLLILKKMSVVSFRAIVILFTGLGIVILAALWDQIIDISHFRLIYTLPFALFLLYIILIYIPFVVFIKEILKQKSVIEQEKNWRMLVDETDIIVVGLNRMGHVDYINPYFFKLTGYEKEEVIGKDWFEFFIPPAEHYNVQGTFVEILSYEFHPQHNNPILTKNQEQKMIRWFNIRTMDTSGNISGSLSVGVDVSEEKREKESLKRKLKEAENLILKLNEMIEKP